MLELNREYSYEEMCLELGWVVYQGGSARQRQLDAIKRAYEHHVPINPKSGKPKRGKLVLTKKLGEIDYSDGRRGNGRSPLISAEDFDILLSHTIKRYSIDTQPISDSKVRALLFTSSIYEGFGLNVYRAMKLAKSRLAEGERDGLVESVLEGCVEGKAHDYSIRRIASQLERGKAGLPKETVYKQNAGDKYSPAPVDLEERFQEERDTWLYIFSASGTSSLLPRHYRVAEEQARQAILEKCGVEEVRSANAVEVPGGLLSLVYDSDALGRAQGRYRQVVLDSVRSSVANTLIKKEFWGARYVEDWQRRLLERYLEAFVEVSAAWACE